MYLNLRFNCEKERNQDIECQKGGNRVRGKMYQGERRERAGERETEREKT